MTNKSRTNNYPSFLMPPQAKTWVSMGKAILGRPLHQSFTQFLQFKLIEESPDYRAWQVRFLLDRLRICLWIAFPCFLTFVVHTIYTLFLYPQEFNEEIVKYFGDPTLADRLRSLSALSSLATGVLLFACLILQRTSWGRRYPAWLFLGFSWSITIAPQLVGTFLGIPDSAVNIWLLVFLAQATLIPVRWRLHLVSQLGTFAYYAGVNPILGLTEIQGRSIYNTYAFVYLFWVCTICDLAVYLYERLQRSEFESRRELRVFLHAVSHDLKTPVMGTSMVLQNLLKKASEGEVTVSARVLERLLEGNQRQLILINSLLEAHESEVRGTVLHCAPLQLRSLVESVLSDLEPVLMNNQVAVINRVKADLPLVNADTTQLWRVLSNLITNALKHNPPGISLTIDAIVEAKVIRCSVQDNGVGISQKQRTRLFELYTRGSRARYAPGLGLGLYLCRQIITAHGGEIGVTSNLETGSTFWFTLPLESATSKPTN